MREIQETVGRLDGSSRRFAIVAARFNGRLVEALVEGAVDCLLRHGVEPGALHVVRVPGAWELSQALDELARRGSVDGLIALGIVIRGETPHFDYICSGASQGISRVAAEHRIPVGFGLLTCENPQQAQERSGGKAGNKGWEAAAAVLEMADLLSRLRA